MNNIHRLAIVDPNDATRDALKTTLLGMDMVWLEAECSRYEFFADVVAQTHPDIGIVALDKDPEKALSLVVRLVSESPQCSILVVSSSTDGNLILRAMRSGAKEFLAQPVRLEDLIGALDRIGAQRFGRGESKSRSCSVIAVAGATGGVGCTSVAVNLGCALARHEENSVALVDLDLCLGDADVFLDTIPDYTLVDVAQNVTRLDFTLLKRSLTKHSSGLFLLPRPVQMEDIALITPDDLQRVIGLLKATFTHLMLDLSKSYTAIDRQVLQIGRPYPAGHAARSAVPAERGAADDVVRRDGRRAWPRSRSSSIASAWRTADQPQEGPGDDRPRDLLAASQRLSHDGRSAQQRRAADRASAQGRDHAILRRSGRRALGRRADDRHWDGRVGQQAVARPAIGWILVGSKSPAKVAELSLSIGLPNRSAPVAIVRDAANPIALGVARAVNSRVRRDCTSPRAASPDRCDLLAASSFAKLSFSEPTRASSRTARSASNSGQRWILDGQGCNDRRTTSG